MSRGGHAALTSNLHESSSNVNTKHVLQNIDFFLTLILCEYFFYLLLLITHSNKKNIYICTLVFFASFNSICEVQTLSVRQYKSLFEGLPFSSSNDTNWSVVSVSVGLYMFLPVAVCDFPLLQRLAVAPEALTDTRQVFPLSRHILSTFQSSAKSYIAINQRKTALHLPSTCAFFKAMNICWN